MSPYVAILVYCAVAVVVTAGISVVAARWRRPSSSRQSPYECGVPSTGGVGPKFSVRFYLIAMLFVVLDVEAVSFYPWAVRLRQLGVVGLLDMAVFGLLIAIGYAHVWKKGGLDWR